MLVGSMAKSPWVDEDSIDAVSDGESPDGLNDPGSRLTQRSGGNRISRT